MGIYRDVEGCIGTYKECTGCIRMKLGYVGKGWGHAGMHKEIDKGNQSSKLPNNLCSRM